MRRRYATSFLFDIYLICLRHYFARCAIFHYAMPCRCFIFRCRFLFEIFHAAIVATVFSLVYATTIAIIEIAIILRHMSLICRLRFIDY